MATEQNLTMREGDNETIAITITAASAGDALTGVETVVVVLKPDACSEDDDAYALTLSSTDAEEVVILTQTADEITAEAYVPALYLAEPYDRVWRVYTVGASGERRTALYGSVTVTDT